MNKAIKLQLAAALCVGLLLVASCNGDQNNGDLQNAVDTVSTAENQRDTLVVDTAKKDSAQTNSENSPGPAEAEANVHPPH